LLTVLFCRRSACSLSAVVQGGTLASALQLVRQLGGVVIACVVVIELDECAGRKMLVEKHNIRSENIHSLLKY
jgi:adenine/guanine phosphoribosyltransferase-like PRPP-binding protein